MGHGASPEKQAEARGVAEEGAGAEGGGKKAQPGVRGRRSTASKMRHMRVNRRNPASLPPKPSAPEIAPSVTEVAHRRAGQREGGERGGGARSKLGQREAATERDGSGEASETERTDSEADAGKMEEGRRRRRKGRNRLREAAREAQRERGGERVDRSRNRLS